MVQGCWQCEHHGTKLLSCLTGVLTARGWRIWPCHWRYVCSSLCIIVDCWLEKTIVATFTFTFGWLVFSWFFGWLLGWLLSWLFSWVFLWLLFWLSIISLLVNTRLVCSLLLFANSLLFNHGSSDCDLLEPEWVFSLELVGLLTRDEHPNSKKNGTAENGDGVIHEEGSKWNSEWEARPPVNGLEWPEKKKNDDNFDVVANSVLVNTLVVSLVHSVVTLSVSLNERSILFRWRGCQMIRHCFWKQINYTSLNNTSSNQI